MKVSVIIPTHNQPEFTAEAVESVKKQTYRNYEIIIVDDGSDSENSRKLRKTAEAAAAVYVYQENAGPACARNTGIRAAAGELIAFLDSDDLWEPEMLSEALDFFKNNPHIDVVHSNLVFEKDSRVIDEKFDENMFNHQGWIFEESLLMNSRIFLSGLILKKKVLEDVGLFNEELYTAEDNNIIIRIAKKYEIGYIDRKLLIRRIHDTNMSLNKTGCSGTLKNLEDIERRYPELANSKVMKKAYEKRYLIYAFSHFRNYIECKKARKYFFKVLKLNIMNNKALIYCFFTFLPKDFITAGRKIKRALKFNL